MRSAENTRKFLFVREMARGSSGHARRHSIGIGSVA